MNNTEKLGRAIAYLNEHFMDTMSVPVLAEIAGYSASDFQREFTSFYGISVAACIRRMRLCAAAGENYCGLTAATAQKYGLSSSSVFAWAFHREFRVSPREYRKRAPQSQTYTPNRAAGRCLVRCFFQSPILQRAHPQGN